MRRRFERVLGARQWAFLLCMASPLLGCEDAPTETDPAPMSDMALAPDSAVVDAAMIPDLPPRWSDTASLVFEASGDALRLEWAGASDDGEVTAYRVERDGVLIAQGPGTETGVAVAAPVGVGRYTFRVSAGDAADQWTMGPSAAYVVDDSTPPIWADGATLAVSSSSRDGLTLAWPHAIDDVAVSRYLLADGAAAPMVVEGTQFRVETVAPGEDRRFRLWAEDAAGNRSLPLERTVTIPWGPGPVWPEGSTLEGVAVGADGVDVRWTAADDDLGVVEYAIYRDQALVLTVPGDVLAGRVDGLAPNTQYRLSVAAGDAQGNVTQGPATVVRTPDDAPPTWPEGAELVASEITPSSLTLGWTPAEDDVALRHYVLRREGVEDRVVVGTSVRVEGLSPWTEYTFQLFAVDTTDHLSLTGLSVTVRTADRVSPTWPVDALRAEALGPHTIRLAWDAATDDVAVAGYAVWVDGDEVAQLPADAREYLLEDRAPWTEYVLAVEARDAAGNVSPEPPSVRVRSLDTVAPSWAAGDRLDALDVAPHTLRLRWSAPVDDVGIDAYQLYQDGDLLTVLPGDVLEHPIDGLVPWTDYVFELHAADPAGNSTATSLVRAIRTADGEAPTWRPGARIRATDATETGCILRWGEAVDDVDLSYRVYMDDALLATVPGDILEYPVEGLSPWVTYAFAVEAIDPAGNLSPRISVQMRTPDETRPTWPQGARLTYEDLDDQSVRLRWPAAQDEFGVRYAVYRDGELYRDLEGAQTTLFVEALRSASDYYFTVDAIDPAGNIAAPLGLAIRTENAPVWSPERAAADPDRKLLITMHVPGAWDTSMAFDPKGYAFEPEELRITNYPIEAEQRPSYESPIRWAPSDANNAFFEAMARRLLIVNGVDVGSNVTQSAARSVFGGNPVYTYPTIGALHATINAPGAPLALMVHGGYVETGGLVAVSRTSRRHLWASISRPNDDRGNEDAYFHPSTLTAAETLLERRLQRRLDATRFSPKRRALEDMLRARQSGGLAFFDEYDDGASRNGIVAPQIHSGLVAFRAGLTATVNLDFNGYAFSAAEGVNNPTSLIYSILWSTLTEIWGAVEEAGLEEQVVVMVVCPLGRTALNGPDGIKQRWPTTSYLFFGAGIEGNRVVGATDRRMLPRAIHPETLEVVDAGGVTLTTAHIHAALRDFLGIADHPLMNEYPLDAPVLPLFAP